MIQKILVNINNKLIYCKFSIIINSNNLCIDCIDVSIENQVIKIPIYNKYNGIDYYPIIFPINLPIINNQIISPFMILYSYNIYGSDLTNSTDKINTDNLDFFNQIQNLISKDNLSFYNFQNIISQNDSYILFKNHFQNIFSGDEQNPSQHFINNLLFYYKDSINLNNLGSIIWSYINQIKLFSIYTLICMETLNKKIIKNNFPKHIIQISNLLRKFMYNINDNIESKFSFTEYYSMEFNKELTIKDIKPDLYYFIIVNLQNDNTEYGNTISEFNNKDKISSSTNKIIKIQVKKISGNTIFLSNDKEIIFGKYKWYQFNPNYIIDKPQIIYQTFINHEFTIEIIKLITDKNTSIDYNQILNYYYKEQKISNLSSLQDFINSTINSEKNNDFHDFNIIRKFSFTNNFFQNITKKYCAPDNKDNKDNKFFEILGILFDKYNYPLKINRHELDFIFDCIIYLSLYNYKLVFVSDSQNLSETKRSKFLKSNSNSRAYSETSESSEYFVSKKKSLSITSETSKLILSEETEKKNKFFTQSNELLNPNINSIINPKIKTIYINLMKILIQTINNDFESITYNQKFYNDYLHRAIIKILYYDIKSMTINLLKSLANSNSLQKFKNIISTNILLIDVGNKINWNNLSKKLSYLNLYYKNKDIIYFQDKINKNIIPDNYDIRIKKVIENPFEMYKYLRKEKDFIRWTKFIYDRISDIYYTQISLSSDDFTHIGKMLYLLFNINEQNLKDETYVNFINFCNQHNKLVLDSNRINLKIREVFSNIKCNINLGFLAKHLTWEKELITFEEKNDKTPEIIALEEKLRITTKKYYKYKAKYLESKGINPSSIIKNGENYILSEEKEPNNQEYSLISETSSIMFTNKKN
jgi:hypothetical protein